MVLIAILFQPYIKSNNQKQETQPSIQSDSSDVLLAELKDNFPDQNRAFFGNLISSYDISIIKNQDPSFIILISHSKSNLNCFSKKLLKILSKASNRNNDYESLIVKTIKLVNKDHDVAKEILDKDLSKIFNANKIALIDDISNIPAKSMILFHGFADDVSNSKFKGVMILINLVIDEPLSEEEYNDLSNSPKNLNLFAEKKLNEILTKEFQYDQLRALYSRILNNIILLKNDPSC